MDLTALERKVNIGCMDDRDRLADGVSDTSPSE